MIDCGHPGTLELDLNRMAQLHRPSVICSIAVMAMRGQSEPAQKLPMEMLRLSKYVSTSCLVPGGSLSAIDSTMA